MTKPQNNMASSTVRFFQRGCRLLCRSVFHQNLIPQTRVRVPQTGLSSFHTCHRQLQETSTDPGNVDPIVEDTVTAQDDQTSEMTAGERLISSDDGLVFAGTQFHDLPIVYVKATYNNTHINVTDKDSKSMVRTSCGTVGFKNAKKATGVAAQTAGIAAATKAIDKGVKYVRLMVKGLGAGRQASIKGLQMGGLEIVSITDNTPISVNGCRPRKARRI
ncbi:small ribosomal subunit protein uS11m-like [Ptychodera flava]|uniref:small ribosomal subunit protein uS11m-like n=1 Tax=Ptychodera flava TaxID=63121 RepID=UPI00396A2187